MNDKSIKSQFPGTEKKLLSEEVRLRKKGCGGDVMRQAIPGAVSGARKSSL